MKISPVDDLLQSGHPSSIHLDAGAHDFCFAWGGRAEEELERRARDREAVSRFQKRMSKNFLGRRNPRYLRDVFSSPRPKKSIPPSPLDHRQSVCLFMGCRAAAELRSSPQGDESTSGHRSGRRGRMMGSTALPCN